MSKIYSDDNLAVDMNKPTKMCLACGKIFNIPQGRNAARMKYCLRNHFSYCKICGNKFDISRESLQNNTKPKTTCSRKCVAKKVNKTVAIKYGLDDVENVSQVPAIKEKISNSIKEKSQDISRKTQMTMIERYGAATPLQIPEMKAKIAQTNLERYGTTNPAKNAEVRKKISEALKSDN